jgi:hypothetical protein
VQAPRITEKRIRVTSESVPVKMILLDGMSFRRIAGRGMIGGRFVARIGGVSWRGVKALVFEVEIAIDAGDDNQVGRTIENISSIYSGVTIRRMFQLFSISAMRGDIQR